MKHILVLLYSIKTFIFVLLLAHFFPSLLPPAVIPLIAGCCFHLLTHRKKRLWQVVANFKIRSQMFDGVNKVFTVF